MNLYNKTKIKVSRGIDRSGFAATRIRRVNSAQPHFAPMEWR
jgi:hypothetical protein